MDEPRVDLYRISCVAVGIIGLFCVASGAFGGLMLSVIWDLQLSSDPARQSYGLLGLMSRALFMALVAGAPGALVIIYRREIAHRWILPDGNHVARSNVQVGRLCFSLLGVWFVVEGLSGLGMATAELLWPPPAEATGAAALVFAILVALLGVAVVARSKALGVRLGGDAA